MARKNDGGLTYTVDQILWSRRYAKRRDLLRGLLEAGGRYTLAQVDALIEQFMKGKVR